MHEKRRPAALLLALTLLPAAPGAAALGWARADQAAVLGAPLSFGATLRLDPGDEVGAECVRAEVLVGEQPLPAGSVRVDARRSADALTMRVHTDAAIEEPVVTVTLAVGCPPRLSRRFVLFADPPVPAATQQAAAVARSAPVDAALTGTPPAGVAQSAPPVDDAPAPAARAVAPRQAWPPGDARGDAAAGPVDPAPRRAAAPPAPAPERRGAVPADVGSQPGPAGAEAPTSERRAAAAAPERRATAPAPQRRLAASEPERRADAAPRLQLDPVEPPAAAGNRAAPAPAPARSASPAVPSATAAADATATAASAVEDAIAAVTRAASAAEAAAVSASAAATRIAALEQTVSRLQGEADASRRIVADLERRIGAAGDGRLTVPLALTIAALLALALWLWWRVRALEQERRLAWRRAAEAEAPAVAAEPVSAPAVAIASPSSPPAAISSSSPAPASRPPAFLPEPPLVTAEIAMPTRPPPPERTQVLPTGSRHDEVVAREVTIEELLDLEQQAEFFVVLGQDEAAVDLLVGHLRETGGGSPLPYLKLLEIYRRRGDREPYERTRARFNQRFNAYAPDWDADLLQGRSLEDYPGVLPRLQQAWPRPLDAMAELEALLFRKSRGELFDLPAYREVLFLYSLARDLLDREAADSGSVDVLLPVADGDSEFGATSPHPYFSLDRDAPGDPAPSRQTASSTVVDVDLSEPASPRG